MLDDSTLHAQICNTKFEIDVPCGRMSEMQQKDWVLTFILMTWCKGGRAQRLIKKASVHAWLRVCVCACQYECFSSRAIVKFGHIPCKNYSTQPGVCHWSLLDTIPHHQHHDLEGLNHQSSHQSSILNYNQNQQHHQHHDLGCRLAIDSLLTRSSICHLCGFGGCRSHYGLVPLLRFKADFLCGFSNQVLTQFLLKKGVGGMGSRRNRV